MKIFISMPMKGKTNEQIREERKEIEKKLLLIYPNAEFIDTLITEDLDEKHPGLKYLAKSIELLDQADLVYFAKGFTGARGCIIENDVAAYYGIYGIDESYITSLENRVKGGDHGRILLADSPEYGWDDTKNDDLIAHITEDGEIVE